MKRNSKITDFVSTAMLCAVTVLLALTPLGMIPLPPPLPSPTTVHIPVIIAALYIGLNSGLIVSATFGVISCILAYQTPIGLNIFFMNPLIAILPRLMIPVTAWLIYKLISKKIKKESISLIISATVASIANTVFTLGSILLFYNSVLNNMINEIVSAGNAAAVYMDNAAAYVLGFIALPYGCVEAVAAAFIVPVIVIALRKAIRHAK